MKLLPDTFVERVCRVAVAAPVTAEPCDSFVMLSAFEAAYVRRQVALNNGKVEP